MGWLSCPVLGWYFLWNGMVEEGQRVWEQTGFDAETLTIIEAEIQKALLH